MFLIVAQNKSVLNIRKGCIVFKDAVAGKSLKWKHYFPGKFLLTINWETTLYCGFGREKLPNWENISMVDYRLVKMPQLGSTGQERLGKVSPVGKDFPRIGTFPWQGKVFLEEKGFPRRETFSWQGKVSLVENDFPGRESFPRKGKVSLVGKGISGSKGFTWQGKDL